MSDSDSDTDFGDYRYRLKLFGHHKNKVVSFGPTDECFEEWNRIPADTRREGMQWMRIRSFWLPILLERQEIHHATCWAFEIGLISNSTEDISLNNLHKIEIVEAIFRALEQGTLKKAQMKRFVAISNMFNMQCPRILEEALQWLEQTGEPGIRHQVLELGHPSICFIALHHIFTEFAQFFLSLGSNVETKIRFLNVQPSEFALQKCEEMKKRGNENFQKKKFEVAIRFYTQAINYWPDNHIIFGNRALCYIRCQKYLKAVGDGKRATLIKPHWAKGHYRYCEALFFLGEVRRAIQANAMGQNLCIADPEGVRDLEQQQLKFIEIPARELEQQNQKIKEIPDPKGSLCAAEQPKTTQRKRTKSVNKTPAVETKPQPVKTVTKSDPPPPTKNKVSEVKQEVKQEKQPVKKEKNEVTTKNSKPAKSEPSSKNGKGESSTPAAKKKSKDKNQSEDQKREADDKATVCKDLRLIVLDAHSALSDLRSRNAEQAFRKALNILETNTPKELGLSNLDVLLLLYGLVSALTEIGQVEELGEAQRLLERIKSFEERTFQCLVYYAVGRVYLRENRFTLALEQFSDSLQTVKNQITPGKLTWPLTKEIVKETEPDYFKELLERAIDLCKFPPIPDAICRLEKCLLPLKAEIYLTDPDFKGFVRVSCCQNCIIEYHTTCWKSLKTSSCFEKIEKDFLNDSCMTPDCVGKVCCIKIFGPTGLVKCKFQTAIIKPQTPKKPKINQKCTSVKNLKSKEEHRLKRKQHKQSFQEKQSINVEILQKKEDSATQSQQKAWLLYRDRVLLQISQNMELLREEKGLHVSLLTGGLQPWLELDSSKGNQVAVRMLNWQQEPLETLTQAVELLLERKNRVWARVFIQLLSTCLDINPKLSNWACQLNNAGLNAAKSFIERYAEQLEQLDLAFLLNFGPLQDVIIEKLGTRPELFSSIGLTVTDYLKQAAPHDTRLFIWTLEEHRDQYQSCQSILDEYFDMMDGHCSVLKKSDESQTNSPMKSRGRKKKPKRQEVEFVIAGPRCVTHREDWEQDFSEDDSLSFLHPDEPFSVPTHLREQVAEFEEQYNSNRHSSHFKKILDNNPDPTKESLYDFFAQILEEHGPLVAEDPLLVGELGNFPPVARLKIQDAGGFEPFLLESLRFIKMGRRIGLTKHAVSLQQAGHGPSLDDLDDFSNPSSNSPSPYLNADYDSAFTSYVEGYSSAPTVCPVFPDLFEFSSQTPPLGQSACGVNSNDSAHHWTKCDSQHQAHSFLPNGSKDVDVNGGLVAWSSVTKEHVFLKKHAVVQTCQETMRSVAMNTEILERFESCPGDLNKKQKYNNHLEQEIKEMAKGKVNPRYKEEVAALEEDIKKINANRQVTFKEMSLFKQKLEEEVKKDQMEKKANQEELKALKVEIDVMIADQASMTQDIRDNKTSFDQKLADFLDRSNESAAEKMSLEDEIKRCQASFAAATRRSHTARVSVVESRRELNMHGLYRELAIGKAVLTKLDEAAHRFPSPDLEMSRNSWKLNVQHLEMKVSAAEIQYQEQLDQVKKGTRISELLPVNISNQREPPAAASAREFAPPPSSPRSTPPIMQQSAAGAPAAQHRPPSRTLEPPHSTAFEKLIERLATMFPDYTRSELTKFIQEFRSTSGGSLSSLMLQDMIGGVAQLILDHQEMLKTKPNVPGRGSPALCAAPSFAASVWQSFEQKRETHPANALNTEDPCIICHEDMDPIDICVLECRHSFHDKCIRSWLKEKNTCPTCRENAVLSFDFPALPRRQAP